MSNMAIAEWAAAVPAGILIMISLFFSDQRRLRLFNLIGSAIFVIYGVLLLAFSNWETGYMTIVLNIVGSVTHVVWLVKDKREKRQKVKSKPAVSGVVAGCLPEESFIETKK